MARLVFIAGQSGSGKSTSLHTLDPKSSFIINADAHELPFNYKSKYSTELGNYLQGSGTDVIRAGFKAVQTDKKFKVLVLDTWSRVMTDYIMSKSFRTATDGRKAWGKFAQDMYDILDTINTSLRDDLTVYLLCHTDKYFTDSGLELVRIGTHGQQITKMVPESFSTVVLYTHVDVLPGQRPAYHFKTVTSGTDTCKTPIGMFEEELIPNDLNLVTNVINKYYN